MIRAFNGETRIATAVRKADGSVLQVYPSMTTFASLDAWKDVYEGKTFRGEEWDQAKAAAKKQNRDQAKMEKIWTQYISFPKPTDTPMQKAVRDLYGQLNLKDSIVQKRRAIAFPRIETTKLDPGLKVYDEKEGTVLPVYFNRISGKVFFETKDATDRPLEGLTFFGNVNFVQQRVIPHVEPPMPGQPILLVSHSLYTDPKALNNLRSAGFGVLPFLKKFGWVKIGNDYTATVKILMEYPGVIGMLCHNSFLYDTKGKRTLTYNYYDKEMKSPAQKDWSLEDWISTFRHSPAPQATSPESAAH